MSDVLDKFKAYTKSVSKTDNMDSEANTDTSQEGQDVHPMLNLSERLCNLIGLGEEHHTNMADILSELKEMD